MLRAKNLPALRLLQWALCHAPEGMPVHKTTGPTVRTSINKNVSLVRFTGEAAVGPLCSGFSAGGSGGPQLRPRERARKRYAGPVSKGRPSVPRKGCFPVRIAPPPARALRASPAPMPARLSPQARDRACTQKERSRLALGPKGTLKACFGTKRNAQGLLWYQKEHSRLALVPKGTLKACIGTKWNTLRPALRRQASKTGRST